MKNLSTYDQALRFLEFRPRSIAELRRKLLQKGQPSGEVEQVITRLVDQNILDDAAFALQFARTKLVGAGKSGFRVAQELARKGVARAIADQAISALKADEGIDPSAALHRVAGKKWKSLAQLDGFTRKRRLYAFLARRGFNPDEIRDAIAQLTQSATDKGRD